MKKILIIVITMLFLVTGCSKETDKTDAILFKEEYEALNGKTVNNRTYQTISLPEDNAIIYSNIEEILALLKEGTAVIYFGAPDDFSSRREIATLLNTANMTGIEKIYYLNATEIRDSKYLDTNGEITIEKEGTKEYYELLNILNSFLPSYEELQNDTIKRLYFPTVVFVKEGKIIGCHVGTTNSKKNPNAVLTLEEEKELATIYSRFMHDILGDACDKNC